MRPSGILSGTVVTNRGSSVSSSFPSLLNVADPRPSGHGRGTRRHPFWREKIDSEESILIPKRIYLTFMVMKLTNRRWRMY